MFPVAAPEARDRFPKDIVKKHSLEMTSVILWICDSGLNLKPELVRASARKRHFNE
jgi:hypothetical protein